MRRKDVEVLVGFQQGVSLTFLYASPENIKTADDAPSLSLADCFWPPSNGNSLSSNLKGTKHRGNKGNLRPSVYDSDAASASSSASDHTSAFVFASASAPASAPVSLSMSLSLACIHLPMSTHSCLPLNFPSSFIPIHSIHTQQQSCST